MNKERQREKKSTHEEGKTEICEHHEEISVFLQTIKENIAKHSLH